MAISSGQQLANFLRGAWRAEPTAVATDAATLQTLLPLIERSGLLPLAWWRIRHSPLAQTSVGKHLQQEFREYALGIKLQEQRVERAIACLQEVGIDPVLLKGWSNARLYPKMELRPLGDIDLLITPDQGLMARQTLAASPHTRSLNIDLITEFSPLYEMSVQRAIDNSRRVALRQTSVRILAPEDHLRQLCLHFMRHGGWRALWLCDIAALIEAQKTQLDWDRCVAGTRHCVDWIVCTVGLAHHLLGADIEGIPVARQANNLPRWLAPAVVKTWQLPYYYQIDQFTQRKLMREVLKKPGLIKQELRDRWPNPVEVAVATGGVPPSSLHVWPRQLMWYSGRGLRFFQKIGNPGRNQSN